MLEIVDKDGNVSRCEFPSKMADLQTKTIIEIMNLCFKNNVNPFEALKIFGAQIISVAAEMRKDFELKNKENNEGGKE